ncbi:hypothetical protein [Mesorhizobium xinjiangense]|uniref:hypothetical protein n=1 Tax=Mesorhizobium xinjiangense TaxID=2678685 RepID=UPI0012EED9AB|nr:hypothetical protein [Mesorhizobium xinjiangense]
MSNRIIQQASALLPLALIVACAQVETKTALVTPTTGQVLSAGPGDTVLSFQSRRSLPNIVGRADLFGRTTNAGGTKVRYLGTQGQQAVFVRTDVHVESNATTMSETPLILPNYSSTSISGTVGTTPISGTATSTSYQYIPARGSTEYVTAERPIRINLSSGQTLKVEGKTLRVIRVNSHSVDYRIE